MVGKREEIALVRKYRPWVVAVCRKYQGRGFPIKDLVQEGLIGLVHAIRSYDTTRGAPLKAYARLLVQQSIRQSIGQSSLKHGDLTFDRKKLTARTKEVSIELIANQEDGEGWQSIVSDPTNVASDEVLWQKQLTRIIRTTIETLPALERLFLELKLAGASLEEAAPFVGVTTKEGARLFELRTFKKLRGRLRHAI